MTLMQMLRDGLPVAYKTKRPATEPLLQELCDAIFVSNGERMKREFPFMRWSSVLTKPDWSVEALELVVELKYIRKRSDIRPISEAIAADVTKYGDSGKRMLFAVYDPTHLIVDEEEFASEVRHRPNAMLEMIR